MFSGIITAGIVELISSSLKDLRYCRAPSKAFNPGIRLGIVCRNAYTGGLIFKNIPGKIGPTCEV